MRKNGMEVAMGSVNIMRSRSEEEQSLLEKDSREIVSSEETQVLIRARS